MNKVFRTAFLGFFAFCFAGSLTALDIPNRPDGYVTDKAALLSAQGKAQIESFLASYERQTTNQIVVAIFPALEGESLEDFSIRLAEAWKVGQKGRDNGAILLVFKDDRQVRIEVGYGLEGALPDILAGRIIREIIVPRFREGAFEAGIMAGVSAIAQAAAGEFSAGKTGRYQGGERELTPAEIEALSRGARGFFFLILLVVIVISIFDLVRYRQFARDHRIYHARYSFWEWWFRFALLLFIVNALFRMLFYAALFSRGGYHGSRGGFGGFSSGGGSFGGGGASGGW